MTRKTLVKLIAPLAALSLVAAACGDDDDSAAGTDRNGTETPVSAEGASTETGAATLRAGLTDLLTEHVYLAALTSGAALRGDDAAFEAFATALNGPTDSNSADLVAAVTSAYGDDVGAAFDGLWRSEDHIPALVAYTQAAAADDQAGKDAAVQRLTSYARTFGETMNSVNENLPADVVEGAITSHATTLLAVIDAQAAGDQPAVYQLLREAYHHMNGTAAALAGATAAQFPDQFDGEADAPGAELRAGLHSLLREHVWLAASATGGALGGRDAQFEAAATALNGPTNSNSADIVDAIRGVYGDDVGTAFDGLWRSEDHIPAFVAYTQAVAADDEAGKQAAIDRLTSYARTFGETLNSVNPNLPADAVEAAITEHATTLIAVIDAQKAGDPGDVARLLRKAVHHMSGTAAVLASATAQQFPDRF
ncbi:hypothetical protein [Rhabdothermincola sediminis]|uniref:hypothetical protein n=1 Tax=Rhabdothermincola sediminis TaxID=2751370 RepID=UPI001AA042BB|nr:hypothetical protein [Rhabdothermincola sediminis]